jgi:hypothetical protein
MAPAAFEVENKKPHPYLNYPDGGAIAGKST